MKSIYKIYNKGFKLAVGIGFFWSMTTVDIDRKIAYCVDNIISIKVSLAMYYLTLAMRKERVSVPPSRIKRNPI